MATTNEVTENTLFCMGNPLLDIQVQVDAEYLEKYGLEANNAVLAEEAHLPIYGDIITKEGVEYVAGGATQNTARAAQWMSDTPKAVTYVGCVGNDDNGKRLTDAATGDNVRVEYLQDESVGTGTCAVLISGQSRSLVANLAAANNYNIEHLQHDDRQALVKDASIYYSAGFFLTVCPDAMLHVAQHAAAENKIYCMNLSAPFLCQFFKDQMLQVLPYADFVFGNEDEAAAFSTSNELGETDIKAIATKIQKMDKVNAARPRIVVFTQGADPTIVATADGIKEFPVIPIEASAIVDTNAAGDAFVGGFLAYLMRGAPIETCVGAGHYAANAVIQCSGATFPGTPTFTA